MLQHLTAPSAASTSSASNKWMQAMEDTSDEDLQGKKAPREEVVAWLRQTFYVNKSYCLPKQVVYLEYVNFCHSRGCTAASAASCGRLVHQAFPGVTCTRKGGRRLSTYHYGNLAFIDLSKQPQGLLAKPGAQYSNRFNTQHLSASKSLKERRRNYHEQRDIRPYHPHLSNVHVYPSAIPPITSDTPIRSFFESPPLILFNSPPTSPVVPSLPNSPVLNSDENEYLDQYQLFDGPCPSQQQQQDSLQMIFDSYYDDLLFSLLQGNDCLAQEVVQRFWREEISYELQRRNINDVLQYELRGILLLVTKLVANPTHLPQEQLSEYLCTISRQLPLWVQVEAMRVLPQSTVPVHKELWMEIAAAIKSVAGGSVL